ncbi:geminin-like [Halichondria panicea]|uniref:geminin-like n=1 Tax=Halichondria panicea TaxID=6063 RepID=UPI00312B6BD8
MREKGKLQAVLDFSSPSSSAAFTDENASESESPVHVVKTVVPKKKVNFLSPPKWKLKHSVGGGSKSIVSGKSQRAALKPLQSNKLNSKLLVGRGSPRIPTVGKTSKLRQSVISCTSPLSTKQSTKQSDAPILCTAEQGTQTNSDVTLSLDYRMCTQEEPPSEYWQILAERRRVALAEALKENEVLYTEREDWKKREIQLESRVKDLEYFAMMYNLASKEDN